jgi:microcystin-dependent protein
MIQPANSSYVGTWDQPLNTNTAQLDAMIGGVLFLNITSTNTTLSSAQYIYKNITFQSTLTGNTVVTFPSTFYKSYEIVNNCTGSSQFTITLTATGAGGTQVIACPPQECIDCYQDSNNNFKFKNLARIGSYWDYAGSSVPAWISACTVPPYLNCDGTTFSTATYPQLFLVLGSTTLPDSKGRSRIALDQGSGRNGLGSVGASSGAAAVALATPNLPPYTPSGVVNVVLNPNTILNTAGSVTAGGGTAGPSGTTTQSANAAFSGVAQGGTSTPFSVFQPTFVAGLMLIRAG